MTETKKVVRKAKKVNPKEVEKARIMEIISNALAELPETEIKDGVGFGMTKGTLIVSTAVCDVQIKPIVPKAGLERYAEIETE